MSGVLSEIFPPIIIKKELSRILGESVTDVQVSRDAKQELSLFLSDYTSLLIRGIVQRAECYALRRGSKTIKEEDIDNAIMMICRDLVLDRDEVRALCRGLEKDGD
ncbi:MAG: histone-like protein [Candidatus Thorarchaeota archaeon]